MKTSLRFLSQAVLFAIVALAASAGSLFAQNDITFKATSIFNNAEPNNGAGRIVVYNLPSTGVYAGPVDARFNVQASIPSNGTRQVAAYGIIMEIDGAAGVTFTTPDPPVSGTPNNMDPAVGVTQNSGLSIILGQRNLTGYQQSDRSIGVIGLHPTQNADTAVTNNHGLFSVPIRVGAGVTGTYTLEMALGGNQYSGFGNSAGVLMSPATASGANNVIEVRESRKADLSGDGLVDGEDIGPFITALSSFNAYVASRPWLQHRYVSDLNNDFLTDGEDIGPFITALSAQGGGSPSASPAAIPEPSTLALSAIGVTVFAARCLRRRRKAA